VRVFGVTTATYASENRKLMNDLNLTRFSFDFADLDRMFFINEKG
jgi:hypothetical protein